MSWTIFWVIQCFQITWTHFYILMNICNNVLNIFLLCFFIVLPLFLPSFLIHVDVFIDTRRTWMDWPFGQGLRLQFVLRILACDKFELGIVSWELNGSKVLCKFLKSHIIIVIIMFLIFYSAGDVWFYTIWKWRVKLDILT